MTRAIAEKTRATNRCDWSNVCAADVVVHTCAVRDKKRGWRQGDFAHLKFCLHCEPTWLPGSLFLGTSLSHIFYVNEKEFNREVRIV